MKKFLEIIFVFGLLNCLACGSSRPTYLASPTPNLPATFTSPETTNQPQANDASVNSRNLERRSNLWIERKVLNYKFAVSLYEGGNIAFADPVLVEVRNGVSVSKAAAPKSRNKDVGPFDRIDTVDKLFDMAREALNRGARVEIRYNSEYGYPGRLSIDYLKGSDSWVVIKVKKFEVVK